MREAMRAGIRAGIDFIVDWRKAAMAAYRRQHGLVAAVPIVWGCIDAYLLPGIAALLFLAFAWFLEGRPGRRLATQALLFAGWASFLGVTESGPATAPAFTNPFAASRQPAFRTPYMDPGPGFGMSCTVVGFASQKRKWTFNVRGERGAYRVQCDSVPFPILPGQRLHGRFQPVPAAPATNPGQFDYPAYLRSQGLDGVLEARSLRLIRPPGGFDRCVIFVRRTLEDALRRSVPEPQLSLLRAALLGITDDLDPSLVEDFKASGMLHILAISGQHIGLFALILLQAFALARLPRKAAYVATGVLLGLYVPVCGSQISVLRAAIMFWTCLPSILWERPSSALNNLGWAAAASLVCMPYQILSLGFQLSFAATFFLILYSRPVAALLKRIGADGALSAYLVSTPALSVVIYLGVYPLLAAVVHAVAPSSILGNLATVGLSSGMLASACLALLTQPLAWAASCFGTSAGALGEMLSASVHTLAGWPGAARSAAALPLAWSLLLLFLVLAFPFALRTGRGLPLLLFGMAAFSARWFCAELREAWRMPAIITYLDVGQGDGAVCRLPGADILIDAGPPDAGRNVILPFLRQQGIDRLDLVIVTHPDLDHYGGLAWVAGHIPIGKVIYSGEEAETRAWKALRATLAERHVPMVKAARGQSLYACRGIGMTVLSPEYAERFPDRNENSVAALLRLRGRRFLFTGDLGPLAEARLMEEGGEAWKGAVLKVPHHGSDLSNALPFLEAVRPPVAVLSAGRLNRFGHPGIATVDELERLGARLFLTARDGAVTYSSDRSGESWGTHLDPGKGGPADALSFAGKANNRRPHDRR